LWGIVVYLWGWGAGRILAFPIGFLAFGLVLFRGLLNTVGFEMQRFTALGSYSLSSALGLDIVRDGLVLYVGESAYVVAEACSGMSSLVSLLALASLWSYVAQGSALARAILLVSVLPLVLLANILRVSLVLLIASGFGREAALGFLHSVSSLALFGFAVVGLLFVSRIVGCRLPRLATLS
jgi:exosortase